VAVAGVGDLARMLRLPGRAGLFPAQEVTVLMVSTPAEGLWRPARGAPVLLLGDSFTNVFSQAELGWGTGAGLAEQLSYHLDRPIDRIAVNAGGSHTTREALARQPERLEGVRLVVYQFAAREFSSGDWRLVTIPATATGSRPATPDAAAGRLARSELVPPGPLR
jgi:alginate O-acetyltransferase complex protein AlgJ